MITCEPGQSSPKKKTVFLKNKKKAANTNLRHPNFLDALPAHVILAHIEAPIKVPDAAVVAARENRHAGLPTVISPPELLDHLLDLLMRARTVVDGRNAATNIHRRPHLERGDQAGQGSATNGYELDKCIRTLVE